LPDAQVSAYASRKSITREILDKVLFILLILAHHRRRVVHVNVTEHPTAQWTAQQVVEAFPWNEAPRYLVRDRDRIYGAFHKGGRSCLFTAI
jgi:hypothetical protein